MERQWILGILACAKGIRHRRRLSDLPVARRRSPVASNRELHRLSVTKQWANAALACKQAGERRDDVATSLRAKPGGRRSMRDDRSMIGPFDHDGTGSGDDDDGTDLIPCQR